MLFFSRAKIGAFRVPGVTLIALTWRLGRPARPSWDMAPGLDPALKAVIRACHHLVSLHAVR